MARLGLEAVSGAGAGPGSKDNGPMLPVLEVNIASHDELVACFEATPGYGRGSAARICAARELGGPFADPADFGRRVAFVSFDRLSSRFEVSFKQSLFVSDRCVSKMPCALSHHVDRARASSPGQSLSSNRAASREGSNKLLEEALKSLGRMSLGANSADTKDLGGSDDIIFASFNVCRMSPRPDSSTNFESKLKVIERLVIDTPGLSLILLQELFSNAAGLIAQRLRAATGDEGWTAVGCGSDPNCEHVAHQHQRTAFSACQASVYNRSLLRCLASSYVDSMEAETTRLSEPLFKRPPHVCVFESARAAAGKLICVANVHVSYKEPRREIMLLASLSRGMKTACVRAFRRGAIPGLGVNDVSVIIAGDFNTPGQSHLFRELRQIGFAELVRSDRDFSSDLRYLQTATSVGGHVLDNIFMQRELRVSELVDAWVYHSAGSGRRLSEESGTQSNGRVRAERSDHFPIVAKLRLGCVDIVASQDGTPADPWRCRRGFEVFLERNRNTETDHADL